MVTTLVTIVHLFVCAMLIGIVLLQQGKGADMGAAFGSGGSNTLFGASGADNFLTRVTTMIALCFMCTSVYLAVTAKAAPESKGELFDSIPAEAPKAAPADPAKDTTATEEKTTDAPTAEAAPAAPQAEQAQAPAAPPAAPAKTEDAQKTP